MTTVKMTTVKMTTTCPAAEAPVAEAAKAETAEAAALEAAAEPVMGGGGGGAGEGGFQDVPFGMVAHIARLQKQGLSAIHLHGRQNLCDCGNGWKRMCPMCFYRKTCGVTMVHGGMLHGAWVWKGRAIYKQPGGLGQPGKAGQPG
jgi:hypothetical protein